MARLESILFVVILFSVNCSQGPTDYKVLQDWDRYVSDHGDHFCRSTVKLTGRRVVERKNVGSDEVRVVIEVTGDWIGERENPFSSGPCEGFHHDKGADQAVKFRITYIDGIPNSQGGHTFHGTR